MAVYYCHRALQKIQPKRVFVTVSLMNRVQFY